MWIESAYPTTQKALFNMAVTMRIADVLDGTSSSIAVVEYLNGLTSTSDVRGSIITNRACGQFVYASATPNSTTPDVMLNYPGFCSGSHNQPSQNLPCAASGNAGGPGTADNNATVTSAQRHTGGVNVLFCDGHVAFISNGITLTTWQEPGGFLRRTGSRQLLRGRMTDVIRRGRGFLLVTTRLRLRRRQCGRPGHGDARWCGWKSAT